MVVAVISWDFSLPGCRSLKQKRTVVRSLKDRLSTRFNVSVAETEHQDTWTRAQITVALVAGDRRLADSMLAKVDDYVEAKGGATIVGTQRYIY